jgi:serine protease Do
MYDDERDSSLNNFPSDDENLFSEDIQKNSTSSFDDGLTSDFSGYGYSNYNIYKNSTVENASFSDAVSPLEHQNSENYINDSLQNLHERDDSIIHTRSVDDVVNQRKKEKTKKSVFKAVVAVCFSVLLVIFIITLSASVFVNKSKKDDVALFEDTAPADTTDEIPDIPVGNAENLDELSDNTIAVIKNVKPSVVCITSVSENQDFFNFTYESEGSGSGVIFDTTDDDIYIMTNCHVIDGAKSVSVSIEGSDLIDARLIGKSENDDLAVIAVSIKDAKNKKVNDVSVAKLGNSDSIQVGTPVIAIGNALGEGNTATSGIISTTSKELTINNTKLTLIQTDAAINPGNSGGALVNGAGEVIGINTAKIVTTSVEGVGYSIPINTAKPVIESLLNKQNAPFLGVYVTTISEQMSSYYNLPQTGVLVSQIIEGSSADGADIYEGDVITGLNGQPIFTAEQLSNAVAECKIGDTVTLTIRKNSKTEVSVKLKANPDKGF